MKICWHDWDVKDKQPRIFIRKLYGLGSNWLWGIGSALSILTILFISYFLFQTPPDFSSWATIVFTISSFVWISGFYALYTFWALTMLDGLTDWRDQVCRKCHQVVLHASENKEEVEAYEAIQGEIKKTLDAQKVNIQFAADESFSYQKSIWEEEK